MVMDSPAYTQQQEETERRLDALDSAARHAARLVRAYGWLRVLTEPGRESRPAPPLLTDDQLAWAREQSAIEAAERDSYAFATGATPARLDVITAQTRAVRVVGRLVRTVGRATGHRFGVMVTLHQLPHALDYLAGDGLDYLVDEPPPRQWAGTSGGELYPRGVLGYAPTTTVDRIVEQLREAADAARTVAGITEDRVLPFSEGKCPACRRRSLQIDATLARPEHWTVTCISEACVCAGPGCGCRQQIRIEGRRHGWPYAELDGPWGLRQAIRFAQEHHPIRSGVAGHGGWAERRRPTSTTGDA